MQSINDDDCPFTEDELRRALTLVYPAEQASSLAHGVAASARSMLTRRDADAALQRGSRDPHEINPETLVLPDFWFALLAALDRTLESRITQWQQRTRRGTRRARERNAMYSAGHDPLAPATATVAELLASEDAAADAAWAQLRADVDALLAQPPEARWRSVQRDAT